VCEQEYFEYKNNTFFVISKKKQGKIMLVKGFLVANGQK
jgi:hypothetical protein